MGHALIFTLCSAIFLLAGYLCYKCLLSFSNQPTFNRGVILFIYLLAALWFIFPEITLHLPQEFSNGIELGQISATATKAADTAPGFSPATTVLTIWIGGMVFFLLRTVMGICSLLRYIARGRKIEHDGYTIIVTDDEPHSPFSWMHYVILHKEDLRDSELIVCHEVAHIRRRHAIDLMIAQLFCIVQWFNPGAWLMKEELMSVQEYQADEDVIGEGINLKEYQFILIKKAVGNRFHQLTNSLNHSQLKKRLTMMMKSKSKRSARLGAAALLPAMLAAAAVINLPEVASAMDSLRPYKDSGSAVEKQAEEVKVADTKGELLAVNSDQAKKNGSKKIRTLSKGTIKTNDPSKVVAYEVASDGDFDVAPAYPGGDIALIEFVMRNMTYPADAFANKAQGKVIVSFVVNTDGSITDVKVKDPVYPSLDAEAIRIVKAIPKKFKPAKKDGKAVNATYNLPINFKLK